MSRSSPSRSQTVGIIYLVHFEKPYKHAGHYQGWTTHLQNRFERHVSTASQRRGSALMRAVILAGIPFKVVRLWQGTRDDERMLHDRRKAPTYCPVCRGEISFRRVVCKLKVESRRADLPVLKSRRATR